MDLEPSKCASPALSTLWMSAVAKYFFFNTLNPQIIYPLKKLNSKQRDRVDFSEAANQGSIAEGSSPLPFCADTTNPSWWRRTQGVRAQHISDQLIWQPQLQTSLCGFCLSLGKIKMIITLLSFDSHKIQLYNCSWQRHLLWFLQPKQQLMHLYNDVPYKTL